jgi:type II secretory pathway predicted ATPase ExeA
MYEEYWGLKEKPFRNTPDPRFLYRSLGHREALARLVYSIEEQMGAAMLTGDYGSGKTIIAQALLDELAKDKYRVALITNPKLTYVELLMAIITSLGVKNLPQKKSEVLTNLLLDTLNEILVNNVKNGKETVVIIDEAHIIDDVQTFDELRLLLNFQLRDRFLLTLLLLGQPELKDKVDQVRQFEQRVGIRYHLGALSREDAEKYIIHRLEVAGRTKPTFTNESVELIHDRSGGLPRTINRICDLGLLAGFIKSVDMVDGEIILEELKDFPVRL